MSGHTIAWRIEHVGGVIAEVTCHEPEDAPCRNLPHDYRKPNDSGCNPILWIDNGEGWIEHYEGPNAPLRDGPITFAWDGTDWTWTYTTTEGKIK